MQIAIGWQCSMCQLSRIGPESSSAPPMRWWCGPFPEGLPEVYDLGKEDCPYREPMSHDQWKPTGVKGMVLSKVPEYKPGRIQP
jgi:hypothetical protein